MFVSVEVGDFCWEVWVFEVVVAVLGRGVEPLGSGVLGMLACVA